MPSYLPILNGAFIKEAKHAPYYGFLGLKCKLVALGLKSFMIILT